MSEDAKPAHAQSAVLTHEPVAWRWKQSASKDWVISPCRPINGLSDLLIEALYAAPSPDTRVREALIKHMVDRFLGWKLPENFSPDAGISFKTTFNEHTAHPMKHEPSGTNLFDATQADAMIRYMLEGF